MALFKVFKGNATGKITDPNNPEYIQPTTATDGYAYYDTSTRKFYINADYNNDGTITRQPINAYHADGADAATLAQAAIYETTGEEGASVNPIRSYYAHNLFRSGDSIQLRNGLGIDIGDNIDISDKANKQYVDNSINSLDVSNISGFGTGKTLKTLTETDGKIAATFQDIAITKSQITDFPGYWANIATTTTATYNKEPEFKTMKLGNGTSATGTKSVQLVYNATTQALNFVFA